MLQEPIASWKSGVNMKEIWTKENWEMALKNDSTAFFSFGQLTMGLFFFFFFGFVF